jgi:hypothetical protein
MVREKVREVTGTCWLSATGLPCLLATVGVLAWLLIAGCGSAQAASSAFGVRFQTNDNGAIETIGNNLETCPVCEQLCGI